MAMAKNEVVGGFQKGVRCKEAHMVPLCRHQLFCHFNNT